MGDEEKYALDLVSFIELQVVVCISCYIFRLPCLCK